MKYLKIKENYGEGIVIGYLILAGLLSFVNVIFLGEKNLTFAICSLGCIVLLVLGMLDNMLIINLITKTNELNVDCTQWREKYEQEYSTCAKLRIKQTELERELDIVKCQLESSKKATQDANQQLRHLEAELGRLKDSKPKSDQDIIDALKPLVQKSLSTKNSQPHIDPRRGRGVPVFVPPLPADMSMVRCLLHEPWAKP